MIGVSGATERYATAVAALPLRASAVDDARGAVMIIDGSPGWARRSLTALEDGAVALIVSHPAAAAEDEIAALSATASPIVLDRPWLRADVVGDAAAREAARHVTADVVGVPAELSALVREAIGWLRVLADGDLELRAAAALPHGLLALLEEPVSGRAATVTASALIGRGGARLRAHAVGETRVEVDLDAATDTRSVCAVTSAGQLQHPRRRESGERLALRRVIAALADGTRPADLRAFAHDSALAARVLAAG